MNELIAVTADARLPLMIASNTAHKRRFLEFFAVQIRNPNTRRSAFDGIRVVRPPTQAERRDRFASDCRARRHEAFGLMMLANPVLIQSLKSHTLFNEVLRMLFYAGGALVRGSLMAVS